MEKKEALFAAASCTIDDLLVSFMCGAEGEGAEDVGGVEAREGGGAVRGVNGLLDFLLVTLQLFFCQHSKVEQAIDSSRFFINNNVLNITSQPSIKSSNLIIPFLLNTATYHIFL